jgi:hypothetical protein
MLSVILLDHLLSHDRLVDVTVSRAVGAPGHALATEARSGTELQDRKLQGCPPRFPRVARKAGLQTAEAAHTWHHILTRDVCSNVCVRACYKSQPQAASRVLCTEGYQWWS